MNNKTDEMSNCKLHDVDKNTTKSKHALLNTFDITSICKNKNICRICFLLKDEMYQIFGGDKQIPSLFEYLTSFTMESLEVYPKTICKLCYDNLSSASETRKLFIDSFEALKLFISTNAIKIEEIMANESLKPSESDDFLSLLPENTNESDKILDVEKINKNLKKSRTLQKPHECEYCIEKFMKKSSLDVHVRTKHTKEKIYSCDLCNKSYSVLRDLNRHKKTHKEKFICPYCKKEFSFRQSYKKHLEIHNRTDGENSKCEICGQNFKDEKLKIRHIKSNHTNEEYMCNHCQKVFPHISKLTQHMKCHRSYEEKTFKCSVCPKRFNFSHHLANHERFHEGARPYLCFLCGARFSQSHFLTVHMRQHDQNISYKCKICTKFFLSEWRLKRHEQIHKKGKGFLCTICGKQFTMNSSLKRHLHRNHQHELSDEINFAEATRNRTISNLKFNCKFCNSEFEIESLFESHMASHTDENTFVHQICNVSCDNIDHLNIHKNSNEQLESYICLYCSKRFQDAKQLTIHKRIHKKHLRSQICTNNTEEIPNIQLITEPQTFTSSTNLINRIVIVPEPTIYLEKKDSQIIILDHN